MAIRQTQPNLEGIRAAAHPITGAAHDYDPLIEFIGDATYVLLGEATHGTHEFYRARAEITKRLIQEKGFSVIAWEADWPDALRINRFIRGRGDDRSPLESLADFKRFPRWMWRNADILELVRWLRTHNDGLPSGSPKVGVYGLDLYSLYGSIESVIAYLAKVDPKAAEQARRRYACFEDFGEDPQTYGRIADVHPSFSCEQEVVAQLRELQRKTASLLSRDGRLASDELFFTKQNAVVAREAERYYRAMYRGRPN